MWEIRRYVKLYCFWVQNFTNTIEETTYVEKSYWVIAIKVKKTVILITN